MPNFVNIQEFSQSYYLVKQWKDSIRRTIMILAILLSSLIVIWEPMKMIRKCQLTIATVPLFASKRQRRQNDQGSIKNGKYREDRMIKGQSRTENTEETHTTTMTRYRTKTRKKQYKAKRLSNMNPNKKKRGRTKVLANGKQFPLFIRQNRLYTCSS